MRISDWSSDVCSSDLTEIVAVSLKGERVAVIDRVQGEGILSLLDADGTRHEILRYNQHLRGVAVGKPLRIDHKGPDGDERHSWLLLPPGYRSGTRLATIRRTEELLLGEEGGNTFKTR